MIPPPRPWVVGPWVCGPRFYGREDLLSQLARSPPAVHWVAGCRRIGKTSLVRELERRMNALERGPIPVVVDLQGLGTGPDLDLALEDAVLDLAPPAASRLGLEGLPHTQARAPDQLRILGDAARTHGRTLWVLVDEAEGLTTIAATDPALTTDLGAVIVEHPAVASLVVSSIRLRTLARSTGGLDWLHPALAEPVWIGSLHPAAAADLVRQTQLPAASRPDVPPGGDARVLELAGGHPFLLQLLAKRVAEAGDPGAAQQTISGERAVAGLVPVDLSLLPSAHRAVLGRVLESGDQVDPSPEIDELLALGLVRRCADGALAAGNAAIATHAPEWLAANR